MELKTETDDTSEEMNGGCCCSYPYMPVDCTPAGLSAFLF